jgi:hypothetical protein
MIVILHHADQATFEKDMAFLNTQVAVQTTPTA